jgi:elongation factor Ts
MSQEISAKEVATLRARTGAGMMDCKKALQDAGGNMDKAADLLRERGIVKAEKRAERGAGDGAIGMYLHHDGKTGVMVEVNSETDFVARTDDFKALVKDVALHVAATSPLAVSIESLPADVVAKERAFFEKQVAESGKPEAIRGKIVDGMMKKFYEERVLEEQVFVKDETGKQKIGDLVKALSGKTGEKISIRRFARFKVGEV